MFKKIVHFTRLYSPHVGGVEAHVSHLNAEFSKQGLSTVVITQRHDPKLKLVENNNQEIIYRLPVFNPNSNDFISQTIYKFKLWQSIWQLRKVWLSADVLHIHDVFFWLLPFWPLIANKTHITFHGHENEGSPSWKQIWWHKVAAWLCRGDVAIGSFHPKWYGIKSQVVSYGAVNLEQKKLTKRKSSQLIFIGRLEAVNGLLPILNALSILKQNEKLYHLDVYGEGPLLSQAKNYVKDHKLDVVFHGANPNARNYLALYQTAFVSRYLAILETLSSRTKAIAFSHNDLTEDYLSLAPFAKWISITHNPEEIIRALENQQSLSEKAVEWARKQTWEKLASQYMKLWQNKNRN